MINHFKIGLKNGVRLWRICLIVYGIQLLLAIPFGLQVYQVVEASIGDSWELNKLLLDYDHTVYSDFLNKHGASITPILGQLRWLILIYLIVSVFIHAGVLFCIDFKNHTWNGFWKGGSIYFYPFLKIALVFTAILLLWACLIWLPLLSMTQSALEILPSEKSFIFICLGALVVFCLGLIFLFNASLASRFNYLEGERSWFRCIKKGFVWSSHSYLKSTGLVLFYSLSLLLISALYLILENNPGTVSNSLVIFYFYVQQLFILFRIYWRIASYSGVYYLFQSYRPKI